MSETTNTTFTALQKLAPISAEDQQRLLIEAISVVGRQLIAAVDMHVPKKAGRKIRRELTDCGNTFQAWAEKYAQRAGAEPSNVVPIRPAIAAKNTENFYLWSSAVAIIKDIERRAAQ